MTTYKIVLNAHLLSSEAGYRSAGIHGYIYHTLHQLPEVCPDWEFHVLVGDGNPPENGLHIHRTAFDTRHPLRRIAWEQALQPRKVQRLAPDLYHGLAFVAPPRLTCPAVVTVYDLSFIRYPSVLGRARRLYLQTFTRRSAQRAAHVIAISDSTARDLTELFDIPPDKITVARPGVGQEFQPLPTEQIAAFRKEKDLPNRFILHLGTLEPRKNLPMLLRAYAALPSDLRGAVKLVLAGGRGWDYQDVLETITELKLAQDVLLPGYLQSDDLALWYNAADLLVCPSLYEGWGLPVVEAMACGCPTLVSDVSSLPEAAGDSGLRLPPHDETAWRDGLRRALTDTKWRQASRLAGIARAKEFTWRKTAEATLQAYQTVLEAQ